MFLDRSPRNVRSLVPFAQPARGISLPGLDASVLPRSPVLGAWAAKRGKEVAMAKAREERFGDRKLARYREGYRAEAGGWTPMGRLGTPDDIGDVVALPCSEQAGWITGQVIYADGGASLMNPEVPPELQLG